MALVPLSDPGLIAAMRLNNSLALVAMSVLYYDYFLTLATEIDHFWRTAKLSFASALFVLNRYLGLLGAIPVLLEYFGQFAPYRYHQYYAIATQAVIAAMWALRAVAMYNNSKRVLRNLVGLGILLIVFTIALDILKATPTTTDIERHGPVGLCDLSLTFEQSLRSAAGWVVMLCIETTVFILVLIKTINMWSSMRYGLLRVLFRDGAIYYGIVIVAGVANIVAFLVPGIHGNERGIGTTLANVLATTLASRMYLNLRDANNQIMRLGQHNWWSIPLSSPNDTTCSTNEVGVTQPLTFRLSALGEAPPSGSELDSGTLENGTSCLA